MSRRRRQEPGGGAEVGACPREWGGRFPVALGYPNHYAPGMSNLGFQSAYRLLSRNPRLAVERFFLPAETIFPAGSRALSAPGPLLTCENRRPVAACRLLIFSVSFEQDFVNLAFLLRAAGLAPLAAERSDADPPVLVGGIITFINPLPLQPLVDGFLIGEGEAQLPQLAAVLAGLADDGCGRRELMAALAPVPGFVAAAALAEPSAEMEVALPRARVDDFVPRTFVCPPPGEQVFADSLLVEVNRGCPRGCRFCAAGFVYRPFRNRSLPVLQRVIMAGIEQFGLGRVGLVGSALGDYPELKSLCRWLRARGLGFSFSSLRLDVLDDELLELLLGAGVRQLTIAPEAGSERLRRALRKELEEPLILAQAARIAAAGIGRLKLYFLIGLPGERRDDLEAIVRLVRLIRTAMLEARARPRLNIALQVSINPFIPKPHTPLQWAAFAPLTELYDKQRYLARELRGIGGVEIEMERPLTAAWQAYLSRAGEEAGGAILTLVAQGPAGRKTRLKRLVGERADRLAARDPALPPPWEFLCQVTPREWLRHEYERCLELLAAD